MQISAGKKKKKKILTIVHAAITKKQKDVHSTVTLHGHMETKLHFCWTIRVLTSLFGGALHIPNARSFLPIKNTLYYVHTLQGS